VGGNDHEQDGCCRWRVGFYGRSGVAWLPRLLNALGFHYHYQFPMMDLSVRRALIITTSHGTLGDTGKDTGVFASEMTVPYYAFSDAGMAVDVASIKGGPIPIEGLSLR
jgi:hypothetical protein